MDYSEQERVVRILLIGSYPLADSPPRGGVQASTYGLAHALHRQLGHEIRVLDPLASGIDRDIVRDDAGVQVHHFALPGKSKSTGIGRIGEVIAAMRQAAPAICNIHGAEPHYLPLMLAARQRGIPCVVTVHGLQFKELRNQFRAKPSLKSLLQMPYYIVAERIMLALAPASIVDTEYVRRELGLRRKTIHVIPQGILHRAENDPARPDRNLLLTIGVINRRKGHHFAIQAFACWADRHPDVRYCIVGTANEPDYLAELRQLITDLHLTQKVQLLIDAPSAQVNDLLSRAWLFVLHSQEESQGIALCEALSRGIPVVATDVAAIPYVVPHGEVGLLSPYGDVATFAENTERLLQDDGLRARMSGAASEWARRFDWQQIVVAIDALFRRQCTTG